MLKISEVRCNYQKGRIVVQDLPQISWILESDNRNVVQTAYQIQIARELDFCHCCYDSNKVISDQSSGIRPEEFKLEPVTRYYVRVRVWDNKKEESEFSEPIDFLSPISPSEGWKADFISAEKPESENDSSGVMVRKEFCLSRHPKQAWLFSTALGLYEVYVNGERVGEDEMMPGWTSYHKHLLYQSYDVTEILREGKNALGALIGAGWYKGKMGFQRFRNLYGKETAFSAELHLIYEDGTREVLRSDDTFSGTKAPILFSEIYDGETYDARLEQKGFASPGFVEDGWIKVHKIPCDRSVIVPQEGCTIRKMNLLPARRLFKTPKGELVLDFGQNLTGWVEFKVRGAISGDRIELNCFEVLDADGNVYTENLRTAKQTIIYFCKGDQEETYHPKFSFQGFRYVRVAEWPGNVNPEDFVAQAVHSDMEETGTFHCSNQQLNQLHHNILWSMKGNFLDVPTDCPQRDERCGWTGDAEIFSRTSSYLMNVYPFFKKWLKDLSCDQAEDGAVTHIVPDILTGYTGDNWLVKDWTGGGAAWGDAAVIIPYVLYQQYGDLDIIKRQYSSMRQWIQYIYNHSEGLIWCKGRQFGDWVALDAEEGSYYGATPNNLVSTAYFAYSTGLLAEMSEAIGERKDAENYRKLRIAIKNAYIKEFFDDKGSLKAQTQTAHIVSLYFDLVPEEYREKTVQGLLNLLKIENGHLVTGFVGTPYFCFALSQNGHVKEAYELLLKDDFPSWLYQVKKGATTIWEHWDGIKPDGSMWSAGMNSFNHYAYGAVGEWMYRVIAGLDTEKGSGFSKSLISPRIGEELDYARGSVKTIHGSLKTYWERNNNIVTLCVTVPANTTAKIQLPDAKRVINSDTIDFDTEDGIIQGTTGSGNYKIEFECTSCD